MFKIAPVISALYWDYTDRRSSGNGCRLAIETYLVETYVSKCSESMPAGRQMPRTFPVDYQVKGFT